MPTYRNNSSTQHQCATEPLVMFEPGETKEINQYRKNLGPDIALVSHSPLAQPWVLLATISSAPSSSVDVTGYDGVQIYNATDDVITLSANNDTENAISIMANTQLNITPDGRIGALQVESMPGSGSVKIWGIN